MMKKLFLLTTAIVSISNGIAAQRTTENVLTVYADDLVNDRYKEYSCRGGELLKRYYQAKEFSKYIRTKWCMVKVIGNPNGENVLMLKKMCPAGGKDNYPEKPKNIKMIVSGIIGKNQSMFGPRIAQRLNIRNLSLDIICQEVFHNGRSYKVILPPDCSQMFQNEEYFNKSSIRSIDLSGATAKFVKTTGEMFKEQNSLISLNLCTFDTSNVNDMRGMFESCKNLISLNLSSFDTSNVKNMQRMFFECRHLTYLNLSSFDTANVTYMWRMFHGCTDLSSIRFSKRYPFRNSVDMSKMFSDCVSLSDLQLPELETRIEHKKMFNKADGIFENCISLSHVPNANELPIRQQDLHDAINMIEKMTAYPE